MKASGIESRPRICVVAPNWIGDAVMSRSLIGLLGAGPARVSVLAPSYTARVYAGMPGVDELLIDGEGGRLAKIRTRTSMLRSNRPAAALLLPPSFSSALPPYFAGIDVRAGDAADMRGALLNAPLQPPAHRGEHLSDTYLRLGRATLDRLGLGQPPSWSAAGVHVAQSERAEAERVRHECADAVRSYAVVVPGATYGPAKSWPEERFHSLCRRLAADTPVLVAGSAREEPMCRRVSEGIAGAYNVAGKTSLGGFIALLESAQAVVANDSGSPHLSAALGTPTVVLFGSTSPRWTAPIGSRVRVVQHPVHCNPCFRRTCPTQLECFHGIEVEDVVAQTLAISPLRTAANEAASK